MIWTVWIALGAFFCATGIAADSMGAHYVSRTLPTHALTIFETAARYQIYHGLGLLAVGGVATRIESAQLVIAGGLMVLGTVLFSGSLYFLAFTGQRIAAAVTPAGGVILIVSWFVLIWSVLVR